jgi:hypothetical protein
MARRHRRCPRSERLRVGVPHGHVWTPPRVQGISWIGAAHDRVLPSVRPLMRPSHAAGPYGSAKGRVHITGTRSKRSPWAWFSRPRLTDVAPYLSFDPSHLRRPRVRSAYAETTGAR